LPAVLLHLRWGGGRGGEGMERFLKLKDGAPLPPEEQRYLKM